MAESSCRLACPPPPSRARLSSFLEHSQHGPRPTMGPSVDPLLDRLIPPSLVELSLARRKLLGPLLLALLLLRTTPVVDLLSNIQIPGRESAERRRERKRIEALTPLTTPVLEKESADLVRRLSVSLSCLLLGTSDASEVAVRGPIADQEL